MGPTLMIPWKMATLGDIAHARSVSVVAEETGLGRDSLHKSLSADGNPGFEIVPKVVNTLEDSG